MSCNGLDLLSCGMGGGRAPYAGKSSVIPENTSHDLYCVPSQQAYVPTRELFHPQYSKSPQSDAAFLKHVTHYRIGEKSEQDEVPRSARVFGFLYDVAGDQKMTYLFQQAGDEKKEKRVDAERRSLQQLIAEEKRKIEAQHAA